MSATSAAPPRAPYFLRAMHAWIGDAGLTPQIIVDTRVEGVRVPAGYADEAGRIVLNIGMEAVRDLDCANDAVSFGARFGGVAHSVYVPMAAILGIYARETGEGLAFGEEERSRAERPPESGSGEQKHKSGPALKLVK